MGFDELCLTWDDHHKTLIGVFEALLESSTLVDCTIAAEGQYLKAHKVVLSACSPYFEMLFTQESEKNPIVVLKDIKFQDLKSLIDFIYRGKVQIPEDRLGDFTDAAESLQIKGLGGGQKRNACEKRGRESPSLPTKEVQILPIARKRSRTVFPRSEEKQCESPNAVNTSRSRRKENVTLSQSMDCATPVLPSSPSDSSSAPPHLGKAQKELREVRPSSSTARSSVCNIETDPEPMTEIFLPETLVEPKSEVCIDETSMMASEDGEEMILGEHLDNDESENSALSSSHGVLKQETNNSFTIEPVAEHSNAGQHMEDIECLIQNSIQTKVTLGQREQPELARNVNNCKQVERKTLRNDGKYTFCKQKIAAARSMKQFVHSCKFQCNNNFSEGDRKLIFKNFWNLGTHKLQNSFICSGVLLTAPINSTPQTIRSKYFTKNFYLRGTRVCQNFFLKTLDISDERLQIACKKKLNEALRTFRSGKKIHATKLADKKSKEVKRHIARFPVYTSRCERADNENHQYSSTDFNLRKMYIHYVEKCVARNSIPTEEWFYRHVFDKEFNVCTNLPTGT